MGHGAVDEDVVIATVCREMGWTYDDYMSQPAYFVELIYEILQGERQAQKKALKKVKSI